VHFLSDTELWTSEFADSVRVWDISRAIAAFNSRAADVVHRTMSETGLEAEYKDGQIVIKKIK
jgi:hypothetical protein